MMLTQQEFERMDFNEISSHHRMELEEFIKEVFPYEKTAWNNERMYIAYTDWYKKTHSKLAKALR